MFQNTLAQKPRGKVVVGLSGGVDSSVAAFLLLQQGYQVEGLFMKNWEEDDEPGHCAAAEDLEDATQVATRLGIPLHRVNFSADYWEQVFSRFLAEHRAARTPNPDVLCNKEIKFGSFLEHALRLGAQHIATGHYARLCSDHRGHHLLLAADAGKDQTYFLHLLGQTQLRQSLFPLGDLTKDRVREIARCAGLPTARKKDSTGICFIGERRFKQFLARYLADEPGRIETIDGRVIGTHRGLAFYTIGQRQGLGLGGIANGAEAPWFVVRKEPERNVLVVAQGHDNPLLMSDGLSGGALHWICGETPSAPPFDCRLRLRHRQRLQDCTVIEIAGKRCRVRFAQPQRAVTPGQSAVFYRKDECLGGAVIEEAWS